MIFQIRDGIISNFTGHVLKESMRKFFGFNHLYLRPISFDAFSKFVHLLLVPQRTVQILTRDTHEDIEKVLASGLTLTLHCLLW